MLSKVLRYCRQPISAALAAIVLLVAQSLFLPSLADPYFDQGRSCYYAGQWDYALRYLGQSLKRDSKRPATYYYIGASYQSLKDSAKASFYFNYLVSHFKGTQEAQMASFALAELGTNRVSDSKKTGSRADARASSTVQNGEMADAETVPFYRSGSNHVLVDCYLNEKPIRCMFDTGATGTFLGINQLRQLGIKPPSGQPTRMASGVAGDVKTWEMPLKIRLGQITRQVKAVVQEEWTLPPILGQDFFRDYTYDTDDAGGMLHFFKKAGAHQAPYDTAIVPFSVEGKDIIVDVQINGRSHPCIFDTGAHTILFTLKDVKQLGLSLEDAQGTASAGVGGTVYGLAIKVDRMQLGPILKTNIDAIVNRYGPAHPLLGQPFYKGYRFTVDNENRVIKFWR